MLIPVIGFYDSAIDFVDPWQSMTDDGIMELFSSKGHDWRQP
jgi:hypothetical protein